MAYPTMDALGLLNVEPEAGNASHMTPSSVPRKRKLDTLFEQSGIDMSTALSLLPPELEDAGGGFSNATSGSLSFPFNQDTISHNIFGPQQETIDSLVYACMTPLARIKTDLVKLYFIHVHPVCPAVDEYHFMTLYNLAKTEAELLEYIELPLLQAMLFTALAHVSREQLALTPYSSVHEAQKVHFDFTRTLYRLQICTKPYVLTQITILLTFWSPCDTELQVNSFWLDRAYYHAREAGIWNPHTSAGNPGDRRAIIWWCCLIRDRMLATGMRRPHRLHQVQNVRGMLKEEDFGLEALLPSFSSRKAKKQVIGAFLAFCRLSEIQAEIAEYQNRFRFSRQWESTTGAGIKEAEELPTVTKFETRLREWKHSFEQEYHFTCDSRDENIYASTLCIFRLILNGLILILYQPYLQWWTCVPFEAKTLWELSLRKLKEGTQDVVSSVRQLVAVASLEAVPAFVTSWITLPTAIYCTLNHVEINSPTLLLTRTERHMLPALLKSMRDRCQGAEFACILINECTQEGSPKQTAFPKPTIKDRSSQGRRRPTSGIEVHMPGEALSSKAEAILLSRCVNNIDSGLANDINDKIIKDRISESPKSVSHTVEKPVIDPQSTMTPASESHDSTSIPSPRALVKYMASYDGKKVLQSAAMLTVSTPSNFIDILHKTAAAANKFAGKSGKMASQSECRATILDAQNRESFEVEMDIEDDQDWDTVTSIVKEWWQTQKNRQFIVNIVVQYC